MFDIGAGEILLIVVLATVVIGPQELPRVMRTLGAFVRKARGVVQGLQENLEEAANRSDLEELKRTTSLSRNQSSNAISSADTFTEKKPVSLSCPQGEKEQG